MKAALKKKVFDVDASNWRSRGDVYGAILKLLGAPTGYAKGLNALLEFMVWDDIKVIEPPYIIRVHNADEMAAGPAEELSWIMEGLNEARAYLKQMQRDDVDITICIVD